jgi:long-chain acyl-CoA synthetase
MTDETARLAAMTMPQVLRYRAQTQGDLLALREKDRGLWRRTTWKGYFENARLLAIGLYALGFRSGDRLAVASDDIPEWLFADLAAQMVGGSCLGIYPTNPWPELQYIVRHSRAKIVVCGDQEQTDKVLIARRNEGGLPDLTTILTVDMKGMRHYAEWSSAPAKRPSSARRSMRRSTRASRTTSPLSSTLPAPPACRRARC